MSIDRRASTTIVPLSDPGGDHASLREDMLNAVSKVIDSGQYILGPQVNAFEEAFAKRLGVRGTVGVGSGTDALVLALLALGIGPGDEVITVSHTAGPTIAAINMTGAAPVLVDIEADTYCLDPSLLEAAIGLRTKAILAVHLYGHPADLDGIGAVARKHGIAVVEDCAQAQEASIGGRIVGAIGDIGCFSFYPTKNLGALGDGGLISVSSAALLEQVRRLRTYGWSRPQFAELPNGRCSRLDELQASILNVKLRSLDAQMRQRRAIAQNYNAAFADLPIICPTERSGYQRTYHLYVIRSDRRDELARHLKDAGVATGLHYPVAVHLQPGLMAKARVPSPLRVTEAVAGEILTLPLFPSMSADQQARVIDSVRSFFAPA